MSNFIRLHQKHFNFKKFVVRALAEDIGDGDHTTLATIPAAAKNTMKLLVKEDGIIAGVEAAEKIFFVLDKSMVVKKYIKDGSAVKKGDVVFKVSGKTRSLLTAERLVLNVMQRMSGIATKANYLQSLCKGTEATVIDTRKTTPGFRFFEKWAVCIGGGANHRYGLWDMILIKDNHIDFCGGNKQALTSVKKYLRHHKKKLKIEIETRTVANVKAVLALGGVHRIMLDNFSITDTKKAIRLINGVVETESSGGITEKNINAYARCGVNYISVGALTHHVKSLDLSLKAV